MRVSFTGTRKGMTIKQWAAFENELYNLTTFEEWHDGDCIGADNQAHKLVENLSVLKLFNPVLIGHPCNLEKYRAYNDFDESFPPLPPLTRNRVMVDSTDYTFATPYEFKEVMRGSGTWATIRYCRLKNRLHTIIYPDGSVEES